MKLGLITDVIGFLDFDNMLSIAKKLGIEAIELTTGNWGNAPHVNIDELLESSHKRKEFLNKIEDSGIELVALNCSGNPLAPNEKGARHHELTLKTFKLAGMLGVEKIVMMSGLPGGSPSDKTANWVVTSWPPENLEILKWQWEEKLIPYWNNLKKVAENEGIKKIALENHGSQCVYNGLTLRKLRDAVGSIIGMNLDPSHLFWMGADPISAARDLGSLIYHVHAKDVRLERNFWEPYGVLDTQAIDYFATRSWNYVAVGHGHGTSWWKEFFSILSFVGYDGPVTLEMEDMSMDAMTGTIKSIEVLKEALPKSFS